MATTQMLSLGTSVPDFSLPSLEGRQVRISDFLGRRVILFMWASW